VGSDPMQYQGLPRHQMVYFERCFSINVNVYHLRDDSVALAVYKSQCHFDDTMHVNQFDHHLSYIFNLQLLITPLVSSGHYREQRGNQKQ
jgi:hypothetical protein